MGFRFHRSVRLFPGVHLNFSKSGVSVSAGVPGATLNFGHRRSLLTLGLPGTGLSYRHAFGRAERRNPSLANVQLPLSTTPFLGGPSEVNVEPQDQCDGEIRSADVASLTSPDWQGLKALINEAAQQLAVLNADFAAALDSREKAWRRLRRREQLPLRLFMRPFLPAVREAYLAAEEEAGKVARAIAATSIRIDVNLDEECLALWSQTAAAHAVLAGACRVWDITSAIDFDRVRERMTASTAITRTLVRFYTVADSFIATAQPGMRFENANGGDLDLFPGFLLMRTRDHKDYALIDLHDLEVSCTRTRFLETEAIPADTEIVDQAWAKANKDGSRDRRFSGNYQIPVVEYGEIRFSTPLGLMEAYQISDCQAAIEFVQALQRFLNALRRQSGQSSSAEGTSPSVEPGTMDDSIPSLPVLPDVRGAYEFYLVPAILATAGFLYVHMLQTQQSIVSGENTVLAAKDSNAGSGDALFAKSDQQNSAVKSQNAEESRQQPVPFASSIEEHREQMIASQNVSVRAAPDRHAAILRVLPQGTKVIIFERDGSWLRAGFHDPLGWVHRSALRGLP